MFPDVVDKCEKDFQYIISNLCYKLHNNKGGQGIKCSGSIFNRKVRWDYTSCFQATQHPASHFSEFSQPHYSFMAWLFCQYIFRIIYCTKIDKGFFPTNIGLMIIFDDHLWHINTYFNSILSFIIAIKYANVFLILRSLNTFQQLLSWTKDVTHHTAEVSARNH